MRPFQGILSLALPLLLACDDASTPTSPAPVQRFFTDELGRARIHHGMNVESRAKGSEQTDPHQPRLTSREIEIARTEWGFTTMRHLIFWGALEPTRGTYDDAYLDEVEQRLDWYAEHGVSCTLDMHQDLYSWRIGGHPTGGNGFPLWTAVTTNQDVIAPTSPWSLAYFLPRVSEAFDNFFSYSTEYAYLQDDFADAWAHVAERFRDHPAVLGYDLVNEPFPGTDWDVLELGVPQHEFGSSYAFDQHKLGPFYQRTVNRIREVDEDTWILYQPRFGYPGGGAPSYLPRLNDPRRGEDRLAQSPHLYSVRYEAQSRYDAFADATVERWEAERTAEGLRDGTPLIVGEWGLDQNFPGAAEFTDATLAMADRMMIGWTYWSWDSDGSWSGFDRTSDPMQPFTERPLMDRLVRVYPMAVAGRPLDFSFDPATRIFRLAFEGVEGVTDRVPTEIFLPEQRVYPDGYYVHTSGISPFVTTTDFDAETNTLRVVVDASVYTHHIIVIGPRTP